MSGAHLLIELFDDHAQVSRPGQKLKKPISFQDMVNLVSETSAQALQYSRSESVRLPANTYLTVYAGNVLNIACYYPEHEATVTHTGKKYLITMPNIVVHYVLKVSNGGKKHEVTDTFYYCTNVEVNNLPNVIPARMSKVFGYPPFPNFYENHRMCFGGNSLLHVIEGGDLRMLKMFYDVIEGSPFNNDLSLYGVAFDGDKAEWFRHLAAVHKEENRFPYENLKI